MQVSVSGELGKVHEELREEGAHIREEIGRQGELTRETILKMTSLGKFLRHKQNFRVIDVLNGIF